MDIKIVERLASKPLRQQIIIYLLVAVVALFTLFNWLLKKTLEESKETNTSLRNALQQQKIKNDSLVEKVVRCEQKNNADVIEFNRWLMHRIEEKDSTTAVINLAKKVIKNR